MSSLRVLAALKWSVAACAASVPVFRENQALLPILIEPAAPAEEKAAAGELARAIGLISGLDWPVRPPVTRNERGFRFSASPESPGGGDRPRLAADLLAPRPGESSPDAFRIRTVAGSVLFEGSTPGALPYAVDWFLQGEAGVRWYSPGPLGEVIPRRAEWILPDLDLAGAPAYVSREFSGLASAADREWARRNGLHATLEFGHALGHLFPPELFSAHPEWFPLLAGRRYQPSSSGDPDWQPNLALPAVANHAADAATAAFLREPERISFSLGINDTVRFDQGSETRRLVEPVRYFRGMPDYSPLVFGFMNRAAAAVARDPAARYLGCVAYFWCEEPPSFPVARSVVPFITTDRTQYYDRDYRVGDEDLMSRWARSGAKAFGLWDYAYGAGFVVPREPLGALAEGIREGWKRGARGYFAELEPQWGFDAFKAWAMARLMWDPRQPVSELEDDFFPGYYGLAAPPMRRFFEACQAQWMGQPGPPFWLKFYRQEDQALLFPPETCVRLRAMLDEAGRLAPAGPCSARVELASRAFAATEAYVAYDHERRELASLDFDRSGAVSEMGAPSAQEGALAAAIGRLARASARVRACLESPLEEAAPSAARNLPESLMRDDPVPRLLLAAARRDASAPRRILDLAAVPTAGAPNGADASVEASWRSLAQGLGGGLAAAANIAVNSSFAEVSPDGQQPRYLFPLYGALPVKWTSKAMATEHGRAGLVAETDGANVSVGPAPRKAFRIEGAWDTQLYQWAPAKPGATYLASARVRGRSSAGADESLVLTFLAVAGQLAGASVQSLPKGDTPRWRLSALGGRAPEGAAWVGVGVASARQAAGDWLEADSIELRAMGLSGSEALPSTAEPSPP